MLFLETLRKTLLLLIVIVNWPYFIIVVSQEEMGMADQWSSQNTHIYPSSSQSYCGCGSKLL